VAGLPTPRDRYPVSWRSSAPFLLAHLVPFAALATGVTWRAVLIGLALYVLRVWFITAGYHRYFAHRSYEIGRLFQFVLALGGLTAAQKGPLWWAAAHRSHHRHADTDRDPHSPQKGFWWSHVGWVLSGRYGATDLATVADLARYPELRFLDRHDWIGPWALAVAVWLSAGWSGLVVGFFASTVLVWHATFAVNSVGHLVGRRRYATADSSRNLLPLALATLGEGWHNNHHHHPTSARQGFRWSQPDVTYQSLRLLARVRLVRAIREPTSAAIGARWTGAGTVDPGRLRQHLARAAATVPPDNAELLAAIESVAEPGCGTRGGATPPESGDEQPLAALRSEA
jgi:stearoyl-CoA desaturase (delta-9 desaturase)